jgi:hypothetical protein
MLLSKKTKTHDEIIEETIRWAKSLGYNIVDHNLGTETGADAIIQNHFDEKVILEVVTGSSFKKLFSKPRIKEVFEPYHPPLTLGLIIVGDRINKVEEHGIKAGFSEEYFESGHKFQRVFPVLTRDFKQVIPVLLVSLLGSRASATGRWG